MTKEVELTKDRVLAALSPIVDPELGFNIVDLGLVYDVHIDDGHIGIDMTFTLEGQSLYEAVKEMVSQIEGVKGAEVNLISDPPWSEDRINPKIRSELGVC